LAFDRDDVRVNQQQGPAVAERVVLTEYARRDECQHGTGLRSGDPSADRAAGLVRSSGHRPHRLGGGPNPPRPVDDSGLGHRAIGVQTGYLANRRFSRLGSGGQVFDNLAPRVIGRRRARAGQPLADRRRESPVNRAPDGQVR
jgi:hypothetical protein